MPRFLVFAYACEPDKGSEPGVGWIWSRMIARIGETWVITRENNRTSIEAHLPAVPERDNLRFVYVDLPERARFWKKGGRGARLYYLLWQAAALRKARALRTEESFDAVWHLTWANAWIGSMAALLPEPFIYGPVAGGVSMPWRLAPALGIRGTLYEIGRALARNGARYANPLARASWRRAQLILVQNPETREWLPRRHRDKAVVFPNVVIDREPAPPRTSRHGPPYVALFAGRLIPWKGVALALRALQRLPQWELRIIGEGSDQPRLKRLAARLDLDGRVTFMGFVPREEVLRWMRRADALLFPSLHDEGGFVVAEAHAQGLPVVCVARGGPPLIGGKAVPVKGLRSIATMLAAALADCLGTQPRAYPHIDARERDLTGILEHRLATRPSEARVISQAGALPLRGER